MGVIFLCGIYGVGKSTVGNMLAQLLKIPYFSASDIITSKSGEKYGRNKVVSNKIRNQEILQESIQEILEEKNRIILDGHFCILNGRKEVEQLPKFIFKEIDIERIILLDRDIQVIQDSLVRRDKIGYKLQHLRNLRHQEIAYAKSMKSELGVPFLLHKLENDKLNIEQLIDFIG